MIKDISQFSLRFSVLTASFMLGFTVSAYAAELKPVTVVASDTLKAGDVFSGLTKDQADYVLGTPPTPGKDLVLDSHTLARVAEAIELNWKPTGPADQVIVRRAATIVTTDDIHVALDKELRGQGLDGKYNILFSDAQTNIGGPQIILPQDQAETVEIKTLHFDPAKDWFEAVLNAPSVAHPVSQTIITGKIQRLASIPVLKNSVRRGDIIGAADINLIDVPSTEIMDGTLLKAENLIGMTPGRIVYAGKPVLDRDIQRPQVLARGDFITLIYNSGMMTLTTKGKAMTNAAQGDIVRVVNIASSRTLQGVASGDHEVTVTE